MKTLLTYNSKLFLTAVTALNLDLLRYFKANPKCIKKPLIRKAFLSLTQLTVLLKYLLKFDEDFQIL